MKGSGSLVTRLGWWFAASLLALYGIPAVLIYLYAAAQARQYAVLTLKSEAETLASYVAETGSLDAPELREAEETPIPIWMRVVRGDRVLARTPGTPEVPAQEVDADPGIVSVSFLGTAATPSYVLVRHQVGGPEPDLWVEAVGSMASLQKDKLRIGAGLLLVGVVLIPLAALGGRALARRALLPIEELVREIRALDPASSPQGRLSLSAGTVEEVAVLSSAFNALLGQLEESLNRMRRFTADASHEIRNPLGILRTGIEIALRRERPTGEYQELLRENLQEIERLQTVVEGVLLLARDTPGSELRIARTPVDLAEVVRPTLAFFAASAAERRVRIDARLEAGLLVNGDAGLLRLAVFNLVDNALKHSPEGAAVRVEARREEETAVLLVADQGPGVRPEDRPRVFERFFRGGPASGSGVGGIGLSVVRWVAEAHGGAARLLDGERGAAFEVALPSGA